MQNTILVLLQFPSLNKWTRISSNFCHFRPLLVFHSNTLARQVYGTRRIERPILPEFGAGIPEPGAGSFWFRRCFWKGLHTGSTPTAKLADFWFDVDVELCSWVLMSASVSFHINPLTHITCRKGGKNHGQTSFLVKVSFEYKSFRSFESARK